MVKKKKPDVVLKHNGQNSRKEAYYLHLKSLRDALRVAIFNADEKDIHNIILELKEGIDIAEHYLFKMKNPHFNLNKMEEPYDVPTAKKLWTLGPDRKVVTYNDADEIPD